MPTYNYKCEKCETIIERILKISDYKKPESEPCPNCGIHGLRQVIHTVGFTDSYSLGRIQPPDYWKSFLRDLDRKNPDNAGFTTW